MDGHDAASAATPEPEAANDLTKFATLIAFNANNAETRFKTEQEIYHREVTINNYARSLLDEVQQLRTENQCLKTDLAEAQSQIFSLQPYIKDITVEEAGRAFDQMTASIEHWVSNFMRQWTADVDMGSQLLISKVESQNDNVDRFIHCMRGNNDLIKASEYPDTDVDIVTSLVWRFLKAKLFDPHAFYSFCGAGELIELVRVSFDTCVEPKRGCVFAQNWRAEAYNALLSRPDFQAAEDDVARKLTRHLAMILSPFIPPGAAEQFREDCHESCVVPAMELRNKMLVSKDRISLDLRTFCLLGQYGAFETDHTFSGYLDEMICEDIFHDRKTFDPSVRQIGPKEGESESFLDDVCVVRPALVMQPVHRDDALGARKIIRRQSMVVAWGTRRHRKLFLSDGQMGCVNRLLNAFEGQDELSMGGGMEAAQGGTGT